MVRENKVFDEDEEEENEALPSSITNDTKKKILLIILPILIIIGLVVSFYAVSTNERKTNTSLNYTVVESTTESTEKSGNLVLYDFEEIDCNLKSKNNKHQRVKIQLTIETPDSDKIEMLEAYRSRVNTLLIEHMLELFPEEVQTSESLYWLKQDLLYRLNLILSPIKITNVNFKTFEIVD